jgi:gliding motility-associated-like protein
VISLSATASDTNGGISKVEFYNGSVKIGEDLTSPYNFAWSNVSEGTYALTAKALDNQNAASTSNIVQITVISSTDLVSVALTDPLNNSTFASGESISINATATSASGSITKVEFFNGDIKLGEDLTSPYNFIWTNVDPGSYVLSAKATNNAGAVGNSASIEIVISGAGPSANAGEDIDVSLPVGSIQLNASGAADDGSAVSYSWKQLSGPSELYFSDASMSAPEVSDLVAGLYTLELSVTDANGRVAKDQVVITVTNSDETIANIPRYFTPNDDGIQDMWVWNSPEQYSNATLTIFNQAGQVIYETVSYQNNWDGTVGGSPLQPGAYYYVIRPGDGVGDIKGAVRIIR